MHVHDYNPAALIGHVSFPPAGIGHNVGIQQRNEQYQRLADSVSPHVQTLARRMSAEFVPDDAHQGIARRAHLDAKPAPVEPVRDDTNPKDLMGALKASVLSVIPASAILSLGGVMGLGARKYGRFNWRQKAVRASVYTDAAMRHLMSWSDGEDVDPESGESHLGHVMACMAILVDAKARGKLVDDRDLHEELRGSAAYIIRETTKKAA